MITLISLKINSMFNKINFSNILFLIFLIPTILTFSIPNHNILHFFIDRVVWMYDFLPSFLITEPSPWTLLGYLMAKIPFFVPEVLMYFHALLPLCVTTYLIYKYLDGKQNPVTLLVLLTLTTSYFFMANIISGINESASISLVILAFMLILKRNYKIAFIIYSLAFLIKVTTILYLPVLIFLSLKSTKFNLSIIKNFNILKITVFTTLLNLPILYWWVKNYNNYFLKADYFENLKFFLLSLVTDYFIFSVLMFIGAVVCLFKRRDLIAFFLFILLTRALFPWGGPTQHYYNLTLLLPAFLITDFGVKEILRLFKFNNELLRSKLLSIPSGKFFSEPFILAASCGVFWFKNKKIIGIFWIFGFFIIIFLNNLLNKQDNFPASNIYLSQMAYDYKMYVPTRQNTDIQTLRNIYMLNPGRIGWTENSKGLVFYIDRKKNNTLFLSDANLSDPENLKSILKQNNIKFILGFKNRSDKMANTLLTGGYKEVFVTGPEKNKISLYEKK